MLQFNAVCNVVYSTVAHRIGESVIFFIKGNGSMKKSIKN